MGESVRFEAGGERYLNRLMSVLFLLIMPGSVLFLLSNWWFPATSHTIWVLLALIVFPCILLLAEQALYGNVVFAEDGMYCRQRFAKRTRVPYEQVRVLSVQANSDGTASFSVEDENHTVIFQQNLELDDSQTLSMWRLVREHVPASRIIPFSDWMLVERLDIMSRSR